MKVRQVYENLNVVLVLCVYNLCLPLFALNRNQIIFQGFLSNFIRSLIKRDYQICLVIGKYEKVRIWCAEAQKETFLKRQHSRNADRLIIIN